MKIYFLDLALNISLIFIVFYLIFSKVPVVILHNNLVWFVDEFLLQFVGGMAGVADKKAMLAAVNFRASLLQQKTSSVARDGLAYAIQVCSWSSKLEELSRMDMSNLKIDDIKRAANVIIQVPRIRVSSLSWSYFVIDKFELIFHFIFLSWNKL